MRRADGPGPAELAPGLFLFPSSVWQMNSAVLCSGGEALVVDPGFFPGEVAALRDFVAGRGLRPTPGPGRETQPAWIDFPANR
ncbi:MAG: hypothetical protein ACM3ZA_12660 [Bacillota bacterium]